jgi:hypothetical protein
LEEGNSSEEGNSVDTIESLNVDPIKTLEDGLVEISKMLGNNK